ncbi:EamA family transporter [Oricola cellulosilytica]|uniref:O-acetylserine/cysteine exporter n=1 Tax=Oricola cellulosilytica TaxID=1429082 RepID=A0A4V2MNU9_9HYPH|nr:EamA family transporter [Oricola cellulosilytica]TCD14547.1 O-acetylserine/cysteine exporter [Oricola cellulosilytica]
MPPGHILLAILVSAVYGTAFVAIKVAVTDIPPLLATGYRFLFAAIPLVFFVRRPAIPAAYLIAYGLVQGGVMFGLIFTAIGLGMPPGLASLVVQLQVFFTVFFAFLAFGEKPTRAEVAGATIALCGIVLIGWSNASVSPVIPFLLVIASGAAWGVANIIAKAAKPDSMLGFIGWSSLVAPVPLFLLSMLVEGTAFGLPPSAPSGATVLSVAYLAYPTTVFAFAAWVFLLRRHSAAAVTPYALLIPVFGMTSTALVFGERLTPLSMTGSLLVFAGLAVHVFAVRFLKRRSRSV